jgi:hypothetical protein
MAITDRDNRRMLVFDEIFRSKMYKIYEFFMQNAFPLIYRFANAPLKNVFALDSYLDME